MATLTTDAARVVPLVLERPSTALRGVTRYGPSRETLVLQSAGQERLTDEAFLATCGGCNGKTDVRVEIVNVPDADRAARDAAHADPRDHRARQGDVVTAEDLPAGATDDDLLIAAIDEDRHEPVPLLHRHVGDGHGRPRERLDRHRAEHVQDEGRHTR